LTPDTALPCAVRVAANDEPRPAGTVADLLILHYTGMRPAGAALDWLCVPESRVSCHYFVHEDGSVVQMVAEDRRAWHAGVSSWRGQKDINSRSIGIEIDNPGHEWGYTEFPGVQIEAVIALCLDICARRSIAPQAVLAHSDVAPARKRDPGELFPWARLHAAGVGHFVEPEPLREGPALRPGDAGEAVAELQRKLAGYGYGIEPHGRYDEATGFVVTAFQRHFRPALVDGVADASTQATLDKLIAALPDGIGTSA